jgi:hypothetical protein
MCSVYVHINDNCACLGHVHNCILILLRTGSENCAQDALRAGIVG